MILKKLKKKNSIDLVKSKEKAKKKKKGKKHYVFVKDFKTFLYDHTLNHTKKYFCCYCLQAFSTKEISKSQIKGCFKVNGKK